MSLGRLLLRRVLLGAAAIWGVLTLVFALFTLTRDWRLNTILANTGGDRNFDPEAVEEAREAYLAARGMDRPLWEQYVDWMGNMFTLQWGESFETGAAVLPTVTDATIRTASYVLPALVLAAVVGLVVGVYAAMSSGSVSERFARGGSYLSFGLPNFWLAVMIAAFFGTVTLRFQPVFAGGQDPSPPTVDSYPLPFVYDYVLPTLLVTTTLLAAMVSYSRAYSLQYVSADVTKLVRAKGGGKLAVARHVVRNASIPLVSLVFAETLALLALAAVVIETLFGIDGLGLLFYNAIWTRDLPLLMGGTMVIVSIGVLGNVIQDLAYTILDPRVDTGER